MKIHVTTERIILRELTPEDEQGIYELDSDPEVHAYLGNNPITTVEEAQKIIQFIRNQYLENGVGRLAIIDKKTAEFIGWAGLKLIKEVINNQLNYYDLGYRLLRKHWGKGYATAAAEASLLYGFNTLALKEIHAMADSKNSASANVLKKAGLEYIETFMYKGVKHDWYRIKRPQWETKQQNNKSV